MPKCQHNVHLLYTNCRKMYNKRSLGGQQEFNLSSVCREHQPSFLSYSDAHYTLHMFAIIFLRRDVFTVREMNAHGAN